MTLAGVTRIDHTLVGVHDLEAARATWQRLGFTITPRGKHIGWGTANYCIMFPDDYVELLGIVDPDQFTNNLDKFLAVREGLLGLAFQSSDMAATAAALAAAGLHPDGPKDLKRELELPEGTVLPFFALTFLPPEETPDLRAFFCQHLTPALIRRPDWLSHDNGARSLDSMSVTSEDPSALAPAYRKIFGDEAVAADDDTTAVTCGPHVLEFVTPAAFESRWPGIARPPGPLPAAAAMTVRVADLNETMGYLHRQGIAPALAGADFVLVDPGDATGVALRFVPSQ